MSSFDKVVKLACKPKAAPPKPKYLDPIIAATWSDGGAIHDVCKALAPRFREPNSIVVFKALIVLHTMIRNGATDNVLGYLSSSEVLRLQNVSAGNWEGYNTPQNVQRYGIYLDSRIRAYRDLKHDVVQVQSESNRDFRVSKALAEDGIQPLKGKESPGVVNRSQTVVGRKLKSMTVEKGLLRETKVVQKMIDALVECRFYLDDLEDQLTITALRMSVKDLLTLFQACNEGVINILEHYFEMSHIDAEDALKIYRRFCKQAERLDEYLSIAGKLQNLLNVPIPNLKLAPVSLAHSLQEYLDDPNFEQNRLEYRANKRLAEKGTLPDHPPKTPEKDTLFHKALASSPVASSSTIPSKTSAPSAAKQSPGKKIDQDFFASIGEVDSNQSAQKNTSPPPTLPHPWTPGNPFSAPMQLPPLPFQQNPVASPFMLPQQTGFFAPQQQPTNPFGGSTFLQTQPTGFLQPQNTGANPFRRSMMFPQMTGALPSFANPDLNNGPGPFAPSASNFSPTGINGVNGGQFGQPQFPFNGAAPAAASPTSPFPANPTVLGTITSPVSFSKPLPARAASTPITASSDQPKLQPVKAHQTGTRNPFGAPVPDPPPPVPKPPTLFELAMMGNSNGNLNGTQQSPQLNQPVGADVGSPPTGVGMDMASVASSFLQTKENASKIASPFHLTSIPESADPTSAHSILNPQNTATTASVSTRTAMTTTDIFSPQTSNTTGAMTTSAFSTSEVPQPSFLKRQSTGVRPFKPTSSFGASLLESLPPIPSVANSNPTAPSIASPTTASALFSLPSQPTAATSPPTLSTAPTTATNFPPPPSTVTSPPTLPNFFSNPSSATSHPDLPIASVTAASNFSSKTLAAASPPTFNPTMGLPNVAPYSSTTSPFPDLSATSAATATTAPSFLSQPSAGFTLQGTSQGTGMSNFGVGLRPQMTGGAANPFRKSMFVAGSSPFGMGVGQSPVSTPFPNFGTASVPNGLSMAATGGGFGSTFAPGIPAQAQQHGESLI